MQVPDSFPDGFEAFFDEWKTGIFMRISETNARIDDLRNRIGIVEDATIRHENRLQELEEREERDDG
jgi:hypothetical protein